MRLDLKSSAIESLFDFDWRTLSRAVGCIFSSCALLMLIGCGTTDRQMPCSAVTSVPPHKAKAGWWRIFNDSDLNVLMQTLACENLQLQAFKAKRHADLKTRLQLAHGEVAQSVWLEQCQSLLLALQIELAQKYLSLRFLDEEIRIVEEAKKSRQDKLSVIKAEFADGKRDELDIEQANMELASVDADLARMTAPRNQLESAIGSLVGKDPGCFTLSARPSPGCALPTAKSGIPVCVLAGRPDVYGALTRLKLADKRLRIEKPCYFPDRPLVGDGLTCSIHCTEFQAWSERNLKLCVEPDQLSGQKKPKLLPARQQKALLDFQKAMQKAFVEVDDALADLAAHCAEKEAQGVAVQSARQTTKLIRERYDEGLLTSTDVTNSERNELAAQRRHHQICGQRYLATVRLIAALGGGEATKFFSH